MDIRYDEYLTEQDKRIMEILSGKSNMEKDEILGGYDNDAI